jgi:hypothetical protein
MRKICALEGHRLRGGGGGVRARFVDFVLGFTRGSSRLRSRFLGFGRGLVDRRLDGSPCLRGLGLLGSLFRLLGGLPGGYVLSDRALLRLPNLSFGQPLLLVDLELRSLLLLSLKRGSLLLTCGRLLLQERRSVLDGLCGNSGSLIL